MSNLTLCFGAVRHQAHRLMIGVALLLLSPLIVIPVQGAPGRRPTQVAVTNVTLIDGTGAPARAGMTVLTRGDRIVAVGPTRSVKLPAGATIVDGRNRFLIPGLCDAHVHLDHGPAVIPQFVAHGVTCVQVMWGPRDSIAAGDRAFPGLESVAGEVPDSADPASAGRFVDSLAALGATLFKIGSDHDRAWLEALARAARSRKLPVVGHLTNAEGIPGAISIRQTRIEHIDTPFLIAASANPEGLLSRWNQAVHRGDRAARNAIVDQALAGITAERMAALMRSLRAGGIALAPTLVNHRATAWVADSNFAADPRTGLVPDSVRKAWADTRPPVLDPAERERARRVYQAKLRLVGAARKQGVMVLAGTDAGSDYRYNGSSLHDELALLVDAGFAPMDALLAATRNPAAAFSHRDYGIVAVGRRADLVLLSADPRTDIRNVARIDAVVLRGRLLAQSDLRSLTGPPGDQLSYRTPYGVLRLVRRGDSVTGTYPHESGAIAGRLIGWLLKGTWRQSDGGGAIELRFTDDYSAFSARYDHAGTPGRWATDWTGSAVLAGGPAGLHGDRSAIAMAGAMIARLGGAGAWAGAQWLHVVEEVYRPAYRLPYRSDTWRDLVSPRIWGRALSAETDRTFAFSPAGVWSVTSGRLTVEPDSAARTWTLRWPGNLYVMYGRLARADSSLRLVREQERRFLVLDQNGEPLCFFEVGLTGDPVRWGTYGRDAEEWIYGPLADFGPLRMPAWGTRLGDAYRFYYREVTATRSAPQLSFDPPR